MNVAVNCAGRANQNIDQVRETLIDAINAHTNNGEYELDIFDAQLLLGDAKEVHNDISFYSKASLDTESGAINITLTSLATTTSPVTAIAV